MQKNYWRWLWNAVNPFVIYIAIMTSVYLAAGIVSDYSQGALHVNTVIAAMIGEVILIPVVFYMLARENMLQCSFGFRRNLWWNGLLPLAVGAVLALAATFVIHMLGGEAMEDFGQAQTIYRQNLAWTVVSSLIVAPIAEEVLFRGLIFRRLKQIAGILPAAIVSSFLFAAGHASVPQVIYGFVMGMILCFLYERTQTMNSVIAMHWGANAASVILYLMI